MTHAIKKIRVSMDWTQTKLGKRAGIVQQRVSLIERGLEAKPDEIERIIKAFGLKDKDK